MRPIHSHLLAPSRNGAISVLLAHRAQRSTICLSCRLGATAKSRLFSTKLSRQFRSTSPYRKDEKPQESIPEDTASKQNSAEETIVRPVPDESLPSHREKQKWSLTNRFHKMMDDLMPKLALASQKINNYTGTDYSGIAALRQEIKEQEQLVRTRHAAVLAAKSALDAAHAQSGTSQKEVVALLERKHSWSASDLERYMTLIRSEHVNEQAVQAAKDAVTTTERALDAERARLERRERAQYHEEQIWSDTIRRNSTWVTFGLMGVNIALLLVNLVAVEPWRRRRMVREIRGAMDEKVQAQAGGGSGEGETGARPAAATVVAGAEIDAVIDPAGVPMEELEAEAVKVEGSGSIHDTAKEAVSSGPQPFEPLDMAWIRSYAASLFSDQLVIIRKVDITTTALQAAVAGATVAAGAVVFLLRPR